MGGTGSLLKGKELRRTRRKIQIVFQDPYSSLNPVMRIAEILEEPLLIAGVEETIHGESESRSCSVRSNLAPGCRKGSRLSCREASGSASRSPGLLP